jgi:type VI secretion system secreted protein Hcp
MAYEFYVTVTGAKQGVFKGDSSRDKDKNKITGLGFRAEVSASVTTATGAAVGRRQYSAISFTKQWGAASPQFIQALVTNEKITSALFEFLKTSATGIQQVYYTIELTDAQVTEVKQFSGNLSPIASSTAELEEVSLVFRKIEVHSLEGKTTVLDDWSTVA